MRSLIIAQGGGPTAVINQTLCGAISAARRLDPTLRILGARHGIRGLMRRDVVDLTGISEADLIRLANTPNSGLGSTRDKPDPHVIDLIFGALEDLDARGFIYIGGNDTAGTLELLRSRSTGSCQFVHAPKTIDNDLVANDHVPGFISAGAFVAYAFLSMDLDFRAMPGIYVGIVMGRHSGFLAAAPVAWKEGPDDAPHLIYSPERAFSVAQFLDDVASVFDRIGRCVVSMSEGVQDETGQPLAEALAGSAVERDAHGNLQLSGGDLGIEIQKALKVRFPNVRARVDTFGYLPRGFLGVVDPIDQREAFEAGVFAAEQVFSQSGSVALQFDGTLTSPAMVPLSDVAGRTRRMPNDFFADANAVSDQGQKYFRRLLPSRPETFTPFV
jgi:6-phosphofructokinase 1